MNRLRTGCLFATGWNLAHSIGWAIVFGIFFWFGTNSPITVQGITMGTTPTGISLTSQRLWATWFATWGGIVGGTIIGIVRWVFLRHWTRTIWTVVANITSWGIGLGLAQFLGFRLVEQLLLFQSLMFFGEPLEIIITFGLTIAFSGGLLAGLSEWFVMRQRMKKMGWWILAKSVGWMIAWMISVPINVIIVPVLFIPLLSQIGITFLGFGNLVFLGIMIGASVGTCGGFIESFGLTLIRLRSDPATQIKTT